MTRQNAENTLLVVVPRVWRQLGQRTAASVFEAQRGPVPLATTATVWGWRNLMNEPAVFFWVVRD